MEHSNSPERFHALDATRAFALLLGVIFHAAWSFITRPTGGPIMDVSGHIGFDWFFYTSHTFRMQLFFLIAGFFAHMMFHRRGARGFLKNRLIKIGIPLMVGWVILFPLMMLTWMWGANVSGRNLTELPLPFLLKVMFGYGLIIVPRSMGGLFSLGHLWFLYYLLWLYALALALRYLMLRYSPANSRLKDSTDRLIAFLVTSPWSLFWLSLITGLFLWTMGGWFGVDTPTFSIQPSVAVLLLYGAFFALGWLMHRQTGLLRNFGGRWKWQLTVGLILSVPLFVGFQGLSKKGVVGGGIMAGYPSLWPREVSDWPRFLSLLKSPETDPQAAPELRYLWDRIEPSSRTNLLQMTDHPSMDVRIGICTMLTKLNVYPELFKPAERGPDGEPLLITPRLLNPAESRQALVDNRKVMEKLFQGTLRSNPKMLPWYGPVKLGYSFGYALVMWLFVFGTLGVFQAKCTGHSATWRYLADSSYWVYLVHIPLVPFLQIWMAAWPWPGLVKFLLLNLISFMILYASYHYLVRSTFIGNVLNGKKYPLILFPWRSQPKP